MAHALAEAGADLALVSRTQADLDKVAERDSRRHWSTGDWSRC